MSKFTIFLIRLVVIANVSVFFITIATSIGNIELFDNQIEVVNMSGEIAIIMLYIMCGYIYALEFKSYTFSQNILRIFIVVLGVIIIPLYILILYGFGLKENDGIRQFFWFNKELQK